MMSTQSPTAQNHASYFVAVDLGSNSFHMLIAREHQGTLEVIDREKEMVQIARGLEPDGTLNTSVQQRALECLKCFRERIKKIPQSRVQAVGTKTLRSAKNADAFLKEAETALGHPIQIISGYEEARLVYQGVSRSITDDHRQRLVVDIGGGSTELIIGREQTPLRLESLSIGCVTFAERYLKAGAINAKTMRTAYLAACEELEVIRHDFRDIGWQITYGASGTMRVIAELMPQQLGAAVITRDQLKALIKETITAGEVVRDSVPKLRRTVLPAGMAILHALFDSFDLEELHVADATLKEGLIYESMHRLTNRDTRDQTVEDLMTRYRVDQQQSRRVKHTALQLWAQVELPDGKKGLLKKNALKKPLIWAAYLHEIGLSISHSSYHNHGFYLLKHSDLGGFSRYDQQLLALLVQLHRRKLNGNGQNVLQDPSLFAAVICLRIAVLLNRGREDLDTPPKLKINQSQVLLSFPPGWLQYHPLTVRSLEREKNYLKSLQLDMVFD